MVLCADETGNWDLNGDIKYLISGLTRCVKQLDVVVVGYPRKVKTIVDIITLKGKGLLENDVL